MSEIETTGTEARGELAELRRAVASLERRSRRRQLLWGTLLAASLLVGLAPRQGPVRAEEFIVRDAAGRARARLGMAGDTPSLALYDAEGALRAALAVDHEGPILNLFGPDGQPRLVAAEREARAFLVLRDVDGAPRAAIAVQETGEPSLYLLDGDLNPIWRQPAQR